MRVCVRPGARRGEGELTEAREAGGFRCELPGRDAALSASAARGDKVSDLAEKRRGLKRAAEREGAEKEEKTEAAERWAGMNKATDADEWERRSLGGREAPGVDARQAARTFRHTRSGDWR